MGACSSGLSSLLKPPLQVIIHEQLRIFVWVAHSDMLLTLPRELRDQIYFYVFLSEKLNSDILEDGTIGTHYWYQRRRAVRPSILQLSRQTREEAKQVLFSKSCIRFKDVIRGDLIDLRLMFLEPGIPENERRMIQAAAFTFASEFHCLSGKSDACELDIVWLEKVFERLKTLLPSLRTMHVQLWLNIRGDPHLSVGHDYDGIARFILRGLNPLCRLKKILLSANAIGGYAFYSWDNDALTRALEKAVPQFETGSHKIDLKK